LHAARATNARKMGPANSLPVRRKRMGMREASVITCMRPAASCTGLYRTMVSHRTSETSRTVYGFPLLEAT
jgi:hypothetical protein